MLELLETVTTALDLYACRYLLSANIDDLTSYSR